MKLEKKQQEHSSWWESARNFKEASSSNNNSIMISETETDSDKSKTYDNLLKKSSYEYYSKWDKWVPSDPVTLEEVRV